MTSTNKISPNAFPYPAELFLPQRPPMLLIDELLERDDESSLVSALLPEKGICFDESEGLLPEYFIEVIAQAIAITDGYESLLSGSSIKNGLLVGVDDFYFLTPPPSSGKLLIKVEKTFDFGAIKIFKGQVHCKEVLLAEGVVKVWEAEEKND